MTNDNMPDPTRKKPGRKKLENRRTVAEYIKESRLRRKIEGFKNITILAPPSFHETLKKAVSLSGLTRLEVMTKSLEDFIVKMKKLTGDDKG